MERYLEFLEDKKTKILTGQDPNIAPEIRVEANDPSFGSQSDDHLEKIESKAEAMAKRERFSKLKV